MARKRSSGSTGLTDTQMRERNARIIELRLSGKTYEAIGKMPGIEMTASAVWKVVQAHYAAREAPTVDALRAIEADRLDRLTEAHWGNAINGEIDHSQMVLKLRELYARLYGLPAPTRTDVTTNGESLYKVYLPAPEGGWNPDDA